MGLCVEMPADRTGRSFTLDLERNENKVYSEEYLSLYSPDAFTQSGFKWILSLWNRPGLRVRVKGLGLRVRVRGLDLGLGLGVRV